LRHKLKKRRKSPISFYMKYLLLSICLLTCFPLLAHDCVVVSGAKKDNNGAFKNRKLLAPATSMVGGKKCVVVDGLKKLKDYIATGKIRAGADLLVIFGAHGSKDEKGVVRFDFNADEPSADEVYSYLRKLSSTYQVGAVMHACQSGEIMNKLIQEAKDPLADKLCLVTSSSRGRMSFSSEKDLISLLAKVTKPNSGKTLEKIFLESPSGMISSAAWEETGVAKYLRTKDLTQKVDIGFKAMAEMDKIVRSPDGECDTPGEANSALCSSGMTDKTYKDLMHFSDPYIPPKDKGNLVTTYTIMASLGEGKMQICLSGLAKFYASKAGTYETWGDLERLLAEIKKDTKLYAVCEAFRKETPDENIKKTLYAGDMQTGLEVYKASLSRLKRMYSKTDWDNFDLNTFASNTAGDKYVCSPSEKKETIQSLFGDNFFKEEYHSDETGNYNGPAEVAPMMNINTQHMMKSFQNACVDKMEMPNTIDAKRRKACANFKL
jgi:hypothetical protein